MRDRSLRRTLILALGLSLAGCSTYKPPWTNVRPVPDQPVSLVLYPTIMPSYELADAACAGIGRKYARMLGAERLVDSQIRWQLDCEY